MNVALETLLQILGEKEVQIYALRAQVAELQRQLDEVEKKEAPKAE